MITKDDVIGNVVSENYKSADVFKKYGIDFCCGGDKSIANACGESGMTEEKLKKLLSDLEAILEVESNEQIDFRSWSLDLLVDYIEKKHHRYVETSIPIIREYLNKIVSVHGYNHPELREIHEIFMEASGELAMHMKKEELMLFPYIRKMVKAQISEMDLEPPHFGTIKNPIEQMDSEHDFEGEAFRRISTLSGGYTPPEDACNSYKTAFLKLKEFEKDLHFHIHLENNLLFPRAIELESELL